MYVDIITAVNGEKITVMKSYEDLTKNKKVGQEYEFTILRNGNEIKVTVTVQRIVNSLNLSADGSAQPLDYTGLGFQSVSTGVNGSFVEAIKYCVPYTFKLAFMVLSTIGGLFTGSVPITSMTGPIGTVGLMAEVGMYDARNFLVLLPLIAANLAVFNLLPVPALDGSKVVFTLIEWIRKKPLNRKVESIIHLVGILLLFGFAIVIDLVGIFV